MRRILSLIVAVSLSVGLVAFSQAGAIVADPIYLSLNTQYSYAVINVINVTYLNLPTSPSLAYLTLSQLPSHINITIELKNLKNGTTLYINAWIPQSLYDHIYLAPNISSAFFVIAVADSDNAFQMNPYVFGNLGQIYDASGKQVSTITVIPLGMLKTVYDGKVIDVSQHPVFQQYLSSPDKIGYAALEYWQGTYIITVSS
ncbi:MAG: hypothetical protein ACP5HQ_01175 [Thermoprotei archaeon]